MAVKFKFWWDVIDRGPCQTKKQEGKNMLLNCVFKMIIPEVQQSTDVMK